MTKNLSVLFNLIICYLICAPLNVKGIYNSFYSNECPVIGVSLGTTNSCVGVLANGSVSIIPNELGNKTTPSVVAFTDEKILIGKSAKQQAVINDRRTLYDIKRLIGRKYTDIIQQDKDELPYEIVEKNNKPYIKVKNEKGETQLMTSEEISAIFLGKMKEIAENFIGYTVSNAVITVPAYFSEDQRQSIRDAGTIAGLKVLRILNEHTAAAIAYDLYKKQGKKNILVYDLGGSNLNISIMAVNDGILDVNAISIDTNLGGADFDKRIMKYFIKLIMIKHNKDITQDKRAIQKLKREVEIAKIRLSHSMIAEIEIKELKVLISNMNSQELSLNRQTLNYSRRLQILCIQLWKIRVCRKVRLMKQYWLVDQLKFQKSEKLFKNSLEWISIQVLILMRLLLMEQLFRVLLSVGKLLQKWMQVQPLFLLVLKLLEVL